MLLPLALALHMKFRKWKCSVKSYKPEIQRSRNNCRFVFLETLIGIFACR